jgi:hypothetical protein
VDDFLLLIFLANRMPFRGKITDFSGTHFFGQEQLKNSVERA